MKYLVLSFFFYSASIQFYGLWLSKIWAVSCFSDAGPRWAQLIHGTVEVDFEYPIRFCSESFYSKSESKLERLYENEIISGRRTLPAVAAQSISDNTLFVYLLTDKLKRSLSHSWLSRQHIDDCCRSSKDCHRNLLGRNQCLQCGRKVMKRSMIASDSHLLWKRKFCRCWYRRNWDYTQSFRQPSEMFSSVFLKSVLRTRLSPNRELFGLLDSHSKFVKYSLLTN